MCIAALTAAAHRLALNLRHAGEAILAPSGVPARGQEQAPLPPDCACPSRRDGPLRAAPTLRAVRCGCACGSVETLQERYFLDTCLDTRLDK
jgi:hypothetical protein